MNSTIESPATSDTAGNKTPRIGRYKSPFRKPVIAYFRHRCCGQLHWVGVNDKLQLVFGNHTKAELARHHTMAAMGNTDCACATFHRSWIHGHKLYDNEVSRSRLVWRNGTEKSSVAWIIAARLSWRRLAGWLKTLVTAEQAFAANELSGQQVVYVVQQAIHWTARLRGMREREERWLQDPDTIHHSSGAIYLSTRHRGLTLKYDVHNADRTTARIWQIARLAAAHALQEYIRWKQDLANQAAKDQQRAAFDAAVKAARQYGLPASITNYGGSTNGCTVSITVSELTGLAAIHFLTRLTAGIDHLAARLKRSSDQLINTGALLTKPTHELVSAEPPNMEKIKERLP